MSFRRTRAVARKEFLHILRDPRSLIMALALPFLLLMLFGYALSLDVDRIPTIVYDQDGSPQSRELIARIQGSRYFQVLGFAGRYGDIQSKIDTSECLLGVVIPRRYGHDAVSGREVTIQVLLDGSDSNTASIALGYIEAVAMTHALELQSRRAMPVEVRVRVWYNNELKSKNFIVPGLIAVILMIIASLITSLTIAREWEMGTMEQLLSTPLRPAELVLGKLSAFFVVGLVDMLIAIVTGVAVFGVPFRGNALLLFFSGCLFLFGALCWGIFLSAVTRSQLLAFQAGILSSFLPAFLLSGFVYAIESMPTVVRAVTHIVPARYFVTLLQGVFLKGVGLRVLWGEIAFLAVYALLVFVVATRKVGQKVA
jgi:ABC-2 type transport system permease protein